MLFFDGCPGHERLLPVVRRLAADAGAEVRLRRVETLDEAEAERFLGSPTVRVDGRDVDPGAEHRDDYGLKCRIYRFDGTQSPAPPEAWIQAALDRATRRALGDLRSNRVVP
ncbi:MAG: DF family (seleno)protein [Solirubrobacteraceae bacterium]